MVEQLTCNEQVVGSSPTGGSRVWLDILPHREVQAFSSRVSDIERNWVAQEMTMLGSLRLKGLDRVELFPYEMALSKPNTSVHPLRQFFL